MKGWLRRQAVAWIQWLFHNWHAVGEQTYAYQRTLSRTDWPIYRFACAVNIDWFEQHSMSTRQERPGFLRAQGWLEEIFVVLGPLKFNASEDPLTLLEGFHRLQARCPRAILILIGDGPLLKQVAAASVDLGEAVQ